MKLSLFKKLIAVTGLFFLAVNFAAAAPIINPAPSGYNANGYSRPSLCKDYAHIQYTSQSFDATTSLSSVAPGQSIKVWAMAANMGDSTSTLNYSISHSGQGTSQHSFTVNISGLPAKTVTANFTGNTNVTVSASDIFQRTVASATLPSSVYLSNSNGTSTSASLSLPGANTSVLDCSPSGTNSFIWGDFGLAANPSSGWGFEKGLVVTYTTSAVQTQTYNPAVTINGSTNGSSSATIGSSISIPWSSTDVQSGSCTITQPAGYNVYVQMNPSSGLSGTSGTITVTPQSGATGIFNTLTFRITCNGLNGNPASANHTVNIGSGGGNPVGQTSVNIQVNGLDGTIPLAYGATANVTYTVSGATPGSCDLNWIQEGSNTPTTGDTIYSGNYTQQVYAPGTFQITCWTGTYYNGTYHGSQVYDSVYVNISGGGGSGTTLDVDTQSEQDVTEDSAELHAYLNNDGTGNTDLWFIISETQSYVNSSSDCTANDADTIDHTNNYNGNGYAFYENANNLSSDTTYYFAACAQDSNGTISHGGVQSFITDEDGNGGSNNGDWSAITNNADDVDDESARLNGEVADEDNIDTWFVYSATDTTPECGTGTSSSTNDEFKNVTGLFDDGQDFDITLNNLDTSKTYYFRACGKKSSTIESGNVKQFTTGSGMTPGPVDGQSAPVVTTLIPTSIGGTSASLASTYSSGGCPVTMWYEYTTIPGSFGQRTTSVNKGNTYGTYTTNVNQLLSGLTYYVRAVGQNCVATTYGNTVSFRTVGQNNGGGGGGTIQQVIQYVGGGNGAEWLKLDIDNNVTTVFVGQTLAYVVKYENLTKSVLQDTEISVVFPKDLRIEGTTQGQVVRNDNSVLYSIGQLGGLEKGEFTVTVRVKSIAAGTNVIGQAIAGFDTPRVRDDTRARVTATDFDSDVVGAGGSFGAAAFGAGPFGLGFIGWLLLLLILVLIYLIARYAAMARNRQYPYYYQQPVYHAPQMYAPQPQPMYAPQPVYHTPAPAPQPVAAAPIAKAPEAEYEYLPYTPVPPAQN